MKLLNKNFFLIKVLIVGILFDYIKNEKEIDLSNEETYSINYIDKNVENNETNIYFFNIRKNAKIKFGLSSSINSEEKINVYIYQKSDDDKKEDEVNINHIIYKEINCEEQCIYYIEYDYQKLHDVIFTLSYIESQNREEIYSISPTNHNNYIFYEYYSLEDLSIYFRIVLYSFNDYTKIPIIITGDLADEKINYIETNNFDETPDEIIRNVGGSNDYLEDIKYIDEGKKKIILYYEKKQNYNVLNFKLRVNNHTKIGFNSIGLSFVFKEDVWNNYGKTFMKNTGIFCLLRLNSVTISSNTTLVIYTNSTVNLQAYEVNEEQGSNFIFGKTDNTYEKKHDIDNNKKLVLINASKEFENKNNHIIFIVEDANEDFMFQFFFIDNNNIIYNRHANRNENINFIREIEHSELKKEQMYIIINEYENVDGKYIYFNDILYGDFKYKTINLDTEIFNNVLYNENFYNPHLINSTADISIFKINEDQILYGYNKYIIKCDNYYHKNLKKGDHIYICLEDNEITEILMPNDGEIKIKISLLFYKKTSFAFSAKINNDNNNFNFGLSNNNNEIKETWNSEIHGNKIIITNTNQIPILLSFKINAEDTSIKTIDKSQKVIKLEKNKIYSLLLPNNINIGKIYGVYQEILSNNEIKNICIYNEMSKDDIFSFPPYASCNNIIKGSKEFNITNYGIYSNNEENNFYTYISFYGEEDVYLYYKHMIISNDILEHKNISKFEESYDIIYYPVKEEINENDFLFLQLIKSSKNELASVYIQSQGNNILNTIDLFYYNTINIFNSYNNSGELFKIPDNTNIVFKFYETKESLFYYEIGSSLTYNYIHDESLKVELFENSKTKYRLIFKPFENEGEANYEIYLFNSTSKYLDILSNQYYIYNLNFEEYIFKLEYGKIISINSDFSEEVKSQFTIDFEYLANDNYNILIVGHKDNPTTKKFYTPIQMSFSKIKLSAIKNAYCFKPNLDNENIIKINLIKNISPEEDGYLIIQWMNYDNKNEEELIIYKGDEQDNVIIYSSSNKENSYLLDTTQVDDDFNIIYIVKDNSNNMNNLICLQYISSIGKTEYNYSEIEYKYFTSLTLPYFFQSKTSLEIFKFIYNEDNINDLELIVDYYNNNGIQILKETYDKSNLKKFDNNYYFGFLNSFINNNISIKINLNILDNITELESFRIQWIEVNQFPTKENFIIINKNPNFYFIDLNEFKEKNMILLVLTNLYNKNEFNFYNGNFFKNDSLRIIRPLYSFDLKEINTSKKNILTFITFSKQNNPIYGYINISLINEKFYINENCNRFELYNKIIKLNKTVEVNNICYYSNKNNEKGKLFYDIESLNEKYISLYYLNDFIKDDMSIENILNNLNKNIITKDNNNIFYGEIEIFKYKYNSNNNANLKLEFYKITELNRTINLSDIENKYFYDTFSLSKKDKLVLNIINYSQLKGLLIIQWINNVKKNEELQIYKGKEKDNIIIYSSSNNENSYLLNISQVDDDFDIIYRVKDEGNNINSQICLQYISSIGKTEYDSSEIEYKYFTSINIPYFVNIMENKTNYEIIQLKYNKKMILNIEVSLYIFNNDDLIYENNYTQNYLKDFGDGNFYLSLNSTNKKYYVNIKINFNNNKSPIDESFFIKKMQYNSFPIVYQSKVINSITQLSYINLTELLNLELEEYILIYTNLLDKGLTIYIGDLFMSNNNIKINKPLYLFNIELINFIFYSSEVNKGFIDFLQINNNTNVYIEEKCNIEKIFNKTYTLIKDKYYIICYNKNKNNNKYNITYSVKSSNDNNKINVYYSDTILSQQTINGILSNLSNKILDKNIIVNNSFEVSILNYEYENRNESRISNITFRIEKYYDNKNKDNDNNYIDINNDHGGLISALLFLIIFLTIIIVFWFRNRNKNDSESYSQTSSSNFLPSDSDKESKKSYLINS